MINRFVRWGGLVPAVLLGFAIASADSPGVPPPPKNPVAIRVAVAPESVASGGRADVTVQLVPASGIKLNKYPRIKVTVPAQDGLAAPADASIGNDAAPPPDQMESNYFKTVDPVKVSLKLDGKAKAGRHEFDGKVSYFYCVAASGYCTTAKSAIKIPVVVR